MMGSQLDKVLAELRRVRDIDLSGYRRNMLQRRLAVRMEQLQCDDPAAYLATLQSDPSECDRLIDTIAINVSSFFRDSIVWEVMAWSVLPEIIHRKKQANNRELRVWSAGCAEGEEAYSLAILIHRALKGELADWRLHIFATDIDQNALQTAAARTYSRDKLENVQLGIVDQYFTPCDPHYQVRPLLPKMVRFSLDDLTSSKRSSPADSIFGTFDLVLCRNVLIYFSQELQNQVLDKLSRSLGPGGYLVLGRSESLSEKMKSNYRDVDRCNRVFQKIR